MAEFSPGSSHNAVATFRNPKSAGFDYNASLCMGAGWTEMAIASFHLNGGQSKAVQFPVTMPSVFGEYPAGFKVSSGGKLIGALADPVTVSIVGPPEFLYASDIRVSRTEDYRHNYIFEVDIQNIGGQAGECTVTAYSSSAYGNVIVTYDNRTQIIQPGQTVTFSGLIENQAYGAAGDPDFWQRLDYITSNAGPISFSFGRSIRLVSFDYPAQIPSGSEYWASQTVHLPMPGKRMFLISLIIRGFEPAYYRVDYSSYVQAGRSFTDVGIVISQEGDYKILGVYDGTPVVQRPAKAEYYWWKLGGWAPIAPGIYTMYSKIRSYEVSDWGEWGSHVDVWDVPIGQVQIV